MNEEYTRTFRVLKIRNDTVYVLTHEPNGLGIAWSECLGYILDKLFRDVILLMSIREADVKNRR